MEDIQPGRNVATIFKNTKKFSTILKIMQEICDSQRTLIMPLTALVLRLF